MDITTLRGLDAHRSALAETAAEMAEMHAATEGGLFDDAQAAQFQGLLEQRTALESAITQLEAREAAVAAALNVERATESPRTFAVPTVHRQAEDVFDLAAYRTRARSVDDLPGLYRDGALRVVDAMSFPSSPNAEASRDRIASIIEKHRDENNGWASRRVIGTSSPVYAEAWTAAMKGQILTGRMQAVMQSYSDGTDGGYALPVAIDPTFVNVSDGTVNPLRAISRVETITTKSWSAVTTAGVTASYVGERTTTGASDGAPTDFANPSATPVRADVSVDVSLEYLQDYGSSRLMTEVGGLITVAKDDLEADKFVMGSGSTEPRGIVDAIIDDTTSIVTTVTNDVFALQDIDKLIGQLPPRFRSRARMVANLAILQLVPAFGTAGQVADSIYNPISKTLRGYPVHEASAMDDAATDAKEILLFGDFNYFVIVDRLGLSSKVVDSYDGSGRPTGNSSIYAAWRNTSVPLTYNAFRLLKVQ